MTSRRHTLSHASHDPFTPIVKAVEHDGKGRRFPCVCGAVNYDGGHALEHFAAHGDVGIEEYRNGEWHHAPFKNIGTWLYYRLRARGEDPEAFLSRILESAERARIAQELEN